MASCSDNPGGAACQEAINERDAVGLALATSTVALFPGSAQAMWGLGAGANAGIGYLADGSVDPSSAVVAGWVNVFSMGNRVVGTVAGMRRVVHLVTGLTTKIHCLGRLLMVPVLVSVMALVKDFHGVLMPGQTGGKVAGIRNLTRHFRSILK
jgi:hypothetical protein